MTTYNRRNNFTSYKRSKYDFCKENLIDYKDASLLRKFITCLLYTSDAADE